MQCEAAFKALGGDDHAAARSVLAAALTPTACPIVCVGQQAGGVSGVRVAGSPHPQLIMTTAMLRDYYTPVFFPIIEYLLSRHQAQQGR